MVACPQRSDEKRRASSLEGGIWRFLLGLLASDTFLLLQAPSIDPFGMFPVQYPRAEAAATWSVTIRFEDIETSKRSELCPRRNWIRSPRKSPPAPPAISAKRAR